MPLHDFHPVVSRWFSDRLGEPTTAQRRGWDAIRAGRDALIAAPTGSGKTLAAFLISIDQLLRESLSGTLPEETRVVYVSPLKALSADIHRNLAEPRRGDPAYRRGNGPGFAANHRRRTFRGHSGRRTRGHAQVSASHPRDDARIALPAPHRAAEPRDAPQCPHRDRGRDPRGGRVAPRGAPGVEPRASGARCASAGAANRIVGHDATDRTRSRTGSSVPPNRRRAWR